MSTKPRDIPVDPSIPPRDWKIGRDINNKNRDALKAMCGNNEIDYKENDVNSTLQELLRNCKNEDARAHKNKILREKAAAKRKKTNATKRKVSQNKRNKPDPIRRPLPLNNDAFRIELPELSFSINKQDENVNENVNTSINNEQDDNENGKEEEKNEQDDKNEKEECIEEETEDALRRIGLTEDQIDVIVAEEFECMDDILCMSVEDLKGLRFKLGAVKAMIRKFDGEKKRKGMNDKGDANIDDKDVVQRLVMALKRNDQSSKDNNNNNNNKKVVKVWIKEGRRRCYIGVLRQESLGKYNRLILKIVIMSFTITDASAMRTAVFNKTRSGEMDKVRCFYDEAGEGVKEKWANASIVVVEKILNLCHGKKIIVIFESDDEYGYSARFGRNTISTTLALQGSLQDAKEVHDWMKSVKEDVPWSKYIKETCDEEAKEYKLGEFDGNGPDWAGFGDWMNSNPDLRKAQDPNDEDNDANGN
eukprot:304041_1